MEENKIGQAKREIEKILKEAGAPYCDVLCYKEDKEIFRYVYGENATGKEKLRMYSCSKPITAVAALVLVERGLLGLDDEVEKYLPEISDCFLSGENGEKVAPKNKMTVRHLLTMTAGFTYNTDTEPIKALKKANPNANLRDFISAFVASPLAFESGTKFEYSLCYDVLAAVIEVASGEKFSAFIKKNIFIPLHMNDSSFDNENFGFSQTYAAGENGEVFPCGGDNYLILTKNYESGGAGLVSTVEDYEKFARCLARGGKTTEGKSVICEELLKEMAKEQVISGSIKNEFTCAQGDDYGYGFGVRVRRKDTEWGLKKGEYGWDGLACSYLLIDPEKSVALVMGMNLLFWPRIFIGKHLEIVRAIYENLL